VVPLAVGGEVFAGGAGGASAATVEVGLEVATVEPALFEAVTLTRSVEPVSPDAGT
jgi:hypothetical protein